MATACAGCPKATRWVSQLRRSVWNKSSHLVSTAVVMIPGIWFRKIPHSQSVECVLTRFRFASTPVAQRSRLPLFKDDSHSTETDNAYIRAISVLLKLIRACELSKCLSPGSMVPSVGSTIPNKLGFRVNLIGWRKSAVARFEEPCHSQHRHQTNSPIV